MPTTHLSSPLLGELSSYRPGVEARVTENCVGTLDDKNNIPSGLSALILAATSQLNEFVEEENKGKIDKTSSAISQLDPEQATGSTATSRQKYTNSEPSWENGTLSEDSERITSRSDQKPSSSSRTTMVSGLHADKNMEEKSSSSFPEILMGLALDPRNEDTIAFLPDGRYFCLRAATFARTLLPRYLCDFCETFDEFLTLMHSWGFSRILHHDDEDNVVEPSRSRKAVITCEDFTGIRPPSRRSSCSSVVTKRRMSGSFLTRRRMSSGNSRSASLTTSTTNSTIEVFRHPKFIKGNWAACRAIRFGESPTDARLSALPNHGTFLDFGGNDSISDTVMTDSASKGSAQPYHQNQDFSKPRLSTSSIVTPRIGGRRNSDEIDESFSTTSPSSLHYHHIHKSKRLSLDKSAGYGGAGDEEGSCMNRSDEVRVAALAATSEKQNLQSGSSNNSCGEEVGAAASLESIRMPLIEQAVKSATHTIVTEAIETLLNDESHTKETFLKHSQELSRSSLPGLVPISKQLFFHSDEGMAGKDEREDDQPRLSAS